MRIEIVTGDEPIVLTIEDLERAARQLRRVDELEFNGVTYRRPSDDGSAEDCY